MLLSTLLLACHTLTTSGPNGLVGKVLHADGTPVAGLAVESLEAKWVTEADGAFAVEFKPPDQHVHFDLDGVWYQRSYHPDDDGQAIEVRLPERRATTVRCELPTACDLQIDWALGPGWVARGRGRCTPGARLSFAQAPTTAPVFTCDEGGTSVPVDVRTDVDGWELTPPPDVVPPAPL